MIYPFKKTTGATSDKVSDYNLKEFYPDINMNTPWANVGPYMREAINTYVLPYIGDTLYDDIVATLQAEDAMTPAVEKFADYLRDVVARYTVMVALPYKKTILASMGAVSNVATEATTGSNIWEFKTTLWAVTQAADRMMDEMLKYMQLQVEAANTYFVTNWAETAAYSAVSSGFFRQVSDFQTYHNINKSLRTFKALVPMMSLVSEQVILPILCQEQYDRLLEAVEQNDATTEEAALLHKVRRVLAKYTVYEASIALTILAEQEGFRVVSNTDAVDRLSYGSDVITNAIQGIREHAERAGRTAKADLLGYLVANVADFPLWEASDCNKTTESNCSIYYHKRGAVMI